MEKIHVFHVSFLHKENKKEKKERKGIRRQRRATGACPSRDGHRISGTVGDRRVTGIRLLIRKGRQFPGTAPRRRGCAGGHSPDERRTANLPHRLSARALHGRKDAFDYLVDISIEHAARCAGAAGRGSRVRLRLRAEPTAPSLQLPQRFRPDEGLLLALGFRRRALRLTAVAARRRHRS